MKKQKGFTLVEIVVVLTIASTIIAAVMVAASAAQRNGRDTVRKADAGKITTAIEQWSANNNGAVPAAATDLDAVESGYLNTSKMKDPSTGVFYNLTYSSTSPVQGGACAKGDIVFAPVGTSSYSLAVCLDSKKYLIYTP